MLVVIPMIVILRQLKLLKRLINIKIISRFNNFNAI